MDDVNLEKLEKLEKRATRRRLGTLLCAMGTILAYGYMIGGVGGYLLGRGRPFVSAAGFLAGTLLAWAAVRLWRDYLADAAELNEWDKRRETASRSS